MRDKIILALVIAVGIGSIWTSKHYHKPRHSVPAPVTLQVERAAPVAVVTLPKAKPRKSEAPKAAVKKSVPKTKSSAKKPERPKAQTDRDFAADLRKLQNCPVLRELRASGKEATGAYEQRLKWALIPWYAENCLFR